MTKEEFKSRIEDLVEKYFEDNDEGISESYFFSLSKWHFYQFKL